jgi:hypothetical protein
MYLQHLTAITLGLVVSCAAFAQSERDLTIEQNNAVQAGKPQPGTLRVTGWVDRQDLTYALGETVRIFVQPNEDAYITAVNVGPSGQVTQLFPNAYQSNNRVQANQRFEITPPESRARIAVSGPMGAELIKIIASSEPVKVIPESMLEGNGVFRSLTGGVSELARNLEVVTTVQPPAGLAIHNLVIKTVASRASISNGHSVVVIPTRPTPVAAPAAAPAVSTPAAATTQAAGPTAPAPAPQSAPAPATPAAESASALTIATTGPTEQPAAPAVAAQ